MVFSSLYQKINEDLPLKHIFNGYLNLNDFVRTPKS